MKYQKTEMTEAAKMTNELMTVKLRYKKPDADESILIVQGVDDFDTELSDTTNNYRFSAAVAGFGLLLRDSKYKGDITYKSVIDIAQSAKGKDAYGYRDEFIGLVKKCQNIH
jgi:Ca-activated chloride channel family protein